MGNSPDEILKRHGLKNTRQRKVVLEEFAKTDTALSQPDLEKRLTGEMDRVTLYRILSSFEESGILHSVLDKHGTMNYASCSASCSADHHHDEHIHFNCTNCKKIFCLEVTIPQVQVPKGFVASQLSLTVTGLCNSCS
jgi:Fur family ferric uptake transcriptional regulator